MLEASGESLEDSVLILDDFPELIAFDVFFFFLLESFQAVVVVVVVVVWRSGLPPASPWPPPGLLLAASMMDDRRHCLAPRARNDNSIRSDAAVIKRLVHIER